MKFEEEVLHLLGELNHWRVNFEKEVFNQFENINKRFEDIDRRFESIDQRFEDIDRRFESIDQRLDNMDKRFEGNDERFMGIDTRLDRMQSDLDDVKKQTDKIPEIERKTNFIIQEVGSFKEKLTIVEQNDDKMAEEQKYQLNKWVDLDRRVDKLERKVLI